MPGRLAAAQVVDQTKAARIVEADDGAIVEGQHDVVVPGCGQCPGAGGYAPGHTEMEQQETVRVELDQDVLAAAAECADPSALEASSKLRRKRPPQIRPTQLRLHYSAPGDPYR